jgi:hypothetical protein
MIEFGISINGFANVIDYNAIVIDGFGIAIDYNANVIDGFGIVINKCGILIDENGKSSTSLAESYLNI